jgi:hypothetical protein
LSSVPERNGLAVRKRCQTVWKEEEQDGFSAPLFLSLIIAFFVPILSAPPKYIPFPYVRTSKP